MNTEIYVKRLMNKTERGFESPQENFDFNTANGALRLSYFK